MDNQLKLYLLGRMSVELNGASVTGFSSAKALALLAYLATTGKMHGRDALAALFWGEMGEPEAKTNLRQAVANLKKLLEPYLIIERDAVAFNFASAHWMDVTGFERALQTPSTPAQNTSQPSAQLTTLEDGIALYRGDFLEGLFLKDASEFEEWLITRREYYREHMLQALRTLARHYSNQGAAGYRQAIHLVTRAVQLDPWREEEHRHLMLLLAKSGQRSAALAQYEKCREVLKRELNVVPAYETTALYERIKLAGMSPRHNLPQPATPFVGRAEELDLVVRQLSDVHCSLMTLVGSGGIGKTRLAVEMAQRCRDEFLHGAFFVPLTAITSADLVVPAIASALGYSLSNTSDPKLQLLNYLREKNLLLVLDNVEQLLAPSLAAKTSGQQPVPSESLTGLLAGILQQAPEVKLLVTSRERLNVHGERVHLLDGLEFPDEKTVSKVETLAGFAAVQLFVHCAQAIESTFAPTLKDYRHIARICQRVQGMPLGIELSAAWIRSLSCAEIEHEIGRSLDFLESTLRDAPDRQRSLRAVFEHSWQMLSPNEQKTFASLSVFRGGCTREAAEHISKTNPSVMAALVDKSFVKRLAVGRYEVHEVMRQYSESKLAQQPSTEAETRDRHAVYFMRFLQQQETALMGGGEQLQSSVLIEAEIENVRVAWAHAMRHFRLDWIRTGLRGLRLYYDLRGLALEATEVFERAVEQVRERLVEGGGVPDQVLVQQVLAQLQASAGAARFWLSQHEQAWKHFQPSLPVLRQSGPTADFIEALSSAAHSGAHVGDYAGGLQLGQEGVALARAAGDDFGLTLNLNALSWLAYLRSDYEAGIAYGQEALEICRRLGDFGGAARTISRIVNNLMFVSDSAEVRALLQEQLEMERTLGDLHGVMVSHYNIGLGSYLSGDYDFAIENLQRALEMNVSVRERDTDGLVYNGLGMIAVKRHHFAEAIQYCQQGLALARRDGSEYAELILWHTLGDVAREQHRYGDSLQHFQSSLRLAVKIQFVPIMLHALWGFASVYAEQPVTDQGHNRALALRLAALTLHHPGAIRETRLRAEPLWQQLAAQFSAEDRAAAKAEAANMDLNAVAERLL